MRRCSILICSVAAAKRLAACGNHATDDLAVSSDLAADAMKADTCSSQIDVHGMPVGLADFRMV